MMEVVGLDLEIQELPQVRHAETGSTKPFFLYLVKLQLKPTALHIPSTHCEYLYDVEHMSESATRKSPSHRYDQYDVVSRRHRSYLSKP
jgi:hypothetical protein